MRYASALALSFALVACSSPPADKAADTAAVAAMPSPASGATGQFPTGTYTVSIERSEIADTSLASNAGTWYLTFAPGGGLTVRLDTIPIAAATYTVTGDQMVVTNDNSTPCQGKGDATFRWAAADSTLTFTPVADRCPDRQLVFTRKPMKRQP